MSAVFNEQLQAIAREARAAGHGGKTVIYEQACEQLGISLATLHRKLKELTTMKAPRKQRSDAGTSALTHEDALMISGTLQETRRQTDKRLWSIEDCVEALRSNGFITAGRVDEATGEFLPLSASAILRALRAYGLHPDQLSQPDPHGSMQSLHPNHMWQIDASLCVLYYLKPKAGQSGLHVMNRDEFYKNKPKNVQSIMADRVWSYEIVDHASGWIYVEYVMGAESGLNLCNVLINAMQERGGADLMHGVPKILYMDPGSANTAAMTKNLCKSLGIKWIAHAPGVARATGSVEKARDIIERKFEAGLRFRPVADLADLNALAAQWRSVFNATAKHRRHKQTRTSAWMRIKEYELIKAPSIEVCRELAVAQPEERVVSPGLLVSFNGDKYRVADVPGVMVGEKLLITRNPWRDDVAQAVIIDEDGHETYHIIPQVIETEWGFDEQAAIAGEAYKAAPHTSTQKAKAAIEKIMMGAETVTEAQAARKAKAIPLAGKFDPYKPLKDVELPTFMPKRGTEHDLKVPTVVVAPLTHLQAAKALRARMGETWQPEMFAVLQQQYPQGIQEDDLASVEQALLNPRPSLKVVGAE